MVYEIVKNVSNKRCYSKGTYQRYKKMHILNSHFNPYAAGG